MQHSRNSCGVCACTLTDNHPSSFYHNRRGGARLGTSQSGAPAGLTALQQSLLASRVMMAARP